MRVLVKDVMSRGIIKLKRNQTTREVNQLFLDRGIDGAPVVDDTGKVIGVFTKTHLMKAYGKPGETQIEALMNKNIMSINESMPIEKAMNIPVGRLPVVDDDGQLVGWLTRTDLARAFVDHYQKSIENLSHVIDFAPHGIVAVDYKGSIKMFNKAAETILGLAAETVLGQRAAEVFKVNYVEKVLDSGKPASKDLTVNGVNYHLDISPIVTGKEISGAVAEFYKPRIK